MVVEWREWETLNPDNFVKMRWKKSGNEITVELFNSSNGTYKGDRNCPNAGFHIWYKNFKTRHLEMSPIFGS